jgi:hypothetical protein
MKACLYRRLRLLSLLLLWLAGCLPIAAYFWPEEIWIRLDLASRGLFVVRVVDKQELNVFRFVEIDNTALRGFVFSGDQMVGYTMWPTGWYPYFAPASGKIDWGARADYEASIRMEDFALKYWKEKNRELAALVGAGIFVPCSIGLGLIAVRFWRSKRTESVSLRAPPP